MNSTEVEGFLDQTNEQPFKVWFKKGGDTIRQMTCVYAGPSKIAQNLAIVKENGAFKSFHTDCVIYLVQGEKTLGKEPS